MPRRVFVNHRLLPQPIEVDPPFEKNRRSPVEAGP